ncbi:hypothetical protein EVAR_64523_1 [Eumeta japonica]|uniref:Uncharacterized protein n=1 Tax=Eumeta variegata TaxID=151549 RepID=A0A4C1ZDU1_EUMVA|nr:hypothetical protein EVAR_64523_1 [Eumeta japonica]
MFGVEVTRQYCWNIAVKDCVDNAGAEAGARWAVGRKQAQLLHSSQAHPYFSGSSGCEVRQLQSSMNGVSPMSCIFSARCSVFYPRYHRRTSTLFVGQLVCAGDVD